MPGSLRVARLGETEIDVHLSFLPVLVWAGWLGAAKYGSLTGALFDVLAVVLLFVCVLVHELAHSLYGRTVGLRTRNILLLPIGGLTSMESAPARARDEIQVALAGPLANLTLGLACSGAILLGAAGLTDDLGALIMTSLRQPSLVGLLTSWRRPTCCCFSSTWCPPSRSMEAVCCALCSPCGCATRSRRTTRPFLADPSARP
jgi:Zn-dependent protease